MPFETDVQMRAARDAEDARLLEAGDYETLLAGWLDTIVDRCRASVYGPEADDVAQNVVERLWAELQRGRRYPVPYRVVVHKVIDWKLKEHWGERRFDAELTEIPDVEYEAYELLIAALDLEALIAGIEGQRQREVAHLRYLAGLDHAQIAAALGMSRNAVDQALWNVHRKLRELLR